MNYSQFASGIMIILMAVALFFGRHKENRNNPWMHYGIPGSMALLGIYLILEVPLGLPQNIAPWGGLALFLFFIVMGFFRFCKNKEKEEQAEKELEEQFQKQLQEEQQQIL